MWLLYALVPFRFFILGVQWASWICELIVCIKFGVIFFRCVFFFSPSLDQIPIILTIRLLRIIPQPIDAMLSLGFLGDFSILIFLCCILSRSLALSSSLLIFLLPCWICHGFYAYIKFHDSPHHAPVSLLPWTHVMYL